MIDILLSRAEERQCIEWATAINDNKTALGKNKGFRGTDPMKSRTDGIRAELAVAKALELPYKVEIYSGGDGGIDIWLDPPTSLGRSIQVKWRGVPERDLATDGLNFHHDLKADIYVLCWPGDGRKIKLVGYCLKSEFLKRILQRPPARMLGLKYEMRWQDLNPIEDLIHAVTGKLPLGAVS